MHYLGLNHIHTHSVNFWEAPCICLHVYKLTKTNTSSTYRQQTRPRVGKCGEDTTRKPHKMYAWTPSTQLGVKTLRSCWTQHFMRSIYCLCTPKIDNGLTEHNAGSQLQSDYKYHISWVTVGSRNNLVAYTNEILILFLFFTVIYHNLTCWHKSK